jgi:hypothetical protein
MNDEAAKVSDRLKASRLLAERGFGKTPMEIFEPVDGDERNERSTGVLRWPSDERLLELAQLAQQLVSRATELPPIPVEMILTPANLRNMTGGAQPGRSRGLTTPSSENASTWKTALNTTRIAARSRSPLAMSFQISTIAMQRARPTMMKPVR